MITQQQAEDLIGTVAFDREHDRIGEVRQVFLDTASDEPTWVGVRVGLFGSDVLVPLDGAEWDAAELRTAVVRGAVRSAPPVDVDEPLTALDEQKLFRHYGIPSVCTPRSQVDLDALAEADVSYSVHDDIMRDDDDSTASEWAEGDPEATGDAMQAAAAEHEATVTGRMLGTAPADAADAAAPAPRR